jgi:hypothetical protein
MQLQGTAIWAKPPMPAQAIHRAIKKTVIPVQRFHYFADGSYATKNYDYNSVKVIGQDTDGNSLTGSYPATALERIAWRTIPMCHTQTMVDNTAQYIYDNLRITQLTGGFIVGHPNVGQEILDVINVKDDATRINKPYRVTGITFELDTSKGYFQQRLDLGGV